MHNLRVHPIGSVWARMYALLIVLFVLAIGTNAVIGKLGTRTAGHRSWNFRSGTSGSSNHCPLESVTSVQPCG
jgi:hypothetical protein